MLELKLFQKGFNYSQDGPGNRLVYHLKGCNMHCPWCSNPEGMSINSNGVFTATTEQITEEAMFSKPMFFENGGVTFTGGECTLQADDLKSTLRELKNNEISTAIETNGSYEKLSELFPFIDFLIMDFKHPDNEKHKQITGISNKKIKQNIILACKAKKELLIRIPLINGFNTDSAAIDGFVSFFSTLKNENLAFEVLKYHEYGKDKWEKLGLTYTMQNAFVEESLRVEFENKIKNIGHKVVRT